MLRDEPVEITGLKVGIVGLGISGRMIADALQLWAQRSATLPAAQSRTPRLPV